MGGFFLDSGKGIEMRSLLLTYLLLTSISQAACLKNGDTVIFTGVLVTKTYKSPDDVPSPVSRWILQLKNPLTCVFDIDKSIPAWNTDVTVFPPDNGRYENFKNIDNKLLNIKGTIILSSTAYDFTALLLFPDDGGVSFQ